MLRGELLNMGFFKDIKDIFDIGKNYILDQYRSSNSREYTVYENGFKKTLTYKERRYDGAELYKDQFGDLWVTRDGGDTFSRYK